MVSGLRLWLNLIPLCPFECAVNWISLHVWTSLSECSFSERDLQLLIDICSVMCSFWKQRSFWNTGLDLKKKFTGFAFNAFDNFLDKIFASQFPPLDAWIQVELNMRRESLRIHNWKRFSCIAVSFRWRIFEGGSFLDFESQSIFWHQTNKSIIHWMIWNIPYKDWPSI